jgi:hypothetical protein
MIPLKEVIILAKKKKSQKRKRKQRVLKVSPEWIRQTREDFRSFLDETDFPDPERLGQRGPKLFFPEWLIMFIAIVSVKYKRKTYLAIHRMVTEYWDVIAEDLELPLISETQLRERLKKICHFPGKPATFIFQLFPEWDKR